MTRDRANEVLFLWKVGAELFPQHVITQALYMTGDLDGPHLEADARLVRVPSLPAWMESVLLASGADVGARPPVHVLEASRTAVGKNAK